MSAFGPGRFGDPTRFKGSWVKVTYRLAYPIQRGHIRARKYLGFVADRPRIHARCVSVYIKGQGIQKQTSQLIASPAMAENPVSHSHLNTSVVASTPACSGLELIE